ncbi:MAG: hypothetical protein HYS57_00510 [Parcubacteria group bacterium]|nr:hypothetical protein [Parcubacteria group bacterium]
MRTIRDVGVVSGPDEKSGPPTTNGNGGQERTTPVSDPYFMRKRALTIEEIVRHDDSVTLIMRFGAGIIVLRTTSNPFHRKIRKILDRIGMVCIGSDAAISAINDALEARIDPLLLSGYTYDDVRGNELGEFLSSALGHVFSHRSEKESEMVIVPVNTFLFEVNHNDRPDLVELVRFDGQSELRLPPVLLYVPKEGVPFIDALRERVNGLREQIFSGLPKDRRIEVKEVVYTLVGHYAKAIREFTAAPFFECVFLNRFAAQARAFKHVWNLVDVEEAIQSIEVSSDEPPASVEGEGAAASEGSASGEIPLDNSVNVNGQAPADTPETGDQSVPVSPAPPEGDDPARSDVPVDDKTENIPPAS